jgi:hypothetical protein
LGPFKGIVVLTTSFPHIAIPMYLALVFSSYVLYWVIITIKNEFGGNSNENNNQQKTVTSKTSSTATEQTSINSTGATATKPKDIDTPGKSTRTTRSSAKKRISREQSEDSQ